jgi:hypothetical protein
MPKYEVWVNPVFSSTEIEAENEGDAAEMFAAFIRENISERNIMTNNLDT